MKVSRLSTFLLLLGLIGCGGGSDSGSDSSTDTTTTSSTDSSSTDSNSSSNDTSSSDSDSTSDSTSETSNLSADAGYDQVVPGGNTVTLSASVSGQSTISWEQISGTSVNLSTTNAASLSFTAPSATTTSRLVFRITASDTAGNNVSDEVSIEVWVPFDTDADASLLGDFSARTGWQCDQNLTQEGLNSTVDINAGADSTTYTITAIPDHAVGTFPNGGNPNAISQQSISYTIPNSPTKTTTATEVRVFGFTLDGVSFERNTAECYNNETACSWRYEAITPGLAAGNLEWSWLGTDCNNGHVQPSGNYHYHGLPESLINQLGDTGTGMTLVGYAADGFPIYARWGYTDANDSSSAIVSVQGSYELRTGTRSSGPGGTYDGTFIQDWEYVAGSGDLDECNGRTGITPEYPQGTYHYYLTDDYPYVPNCVFGTVTDNRFIGR